jgi:hypothetical protein
LKATYTSAEFAVIRPFLRSGTYATPAVSLIARLREFPITDELVIGLLVRGRELPIALATLLLIATVPSGRALVLKFRRHLYEIAPIAPIGVFRLFLVVFDPPTFSTDPEFPPFLDALVRTRDPIVLAGIEHVFARLSVDPELVYELGDVRFFSTFAECAGDAAGAFLAVYARAAAIAWCEDIDRCLDTLIAWGGREDVRERLLQALEAVGKYECVAWAIRKSALVRNLAGMRTDPRFGTLAARVIAVVEKK